MKYCHGIDNQVDLSLFHEDIFFNRTIYEILSTIYFHINSFLDMDIISCQISMKLYHTGQYLIGHIFSLDWWGEINLHMTLTKPTVPHKLYYCIFLFQNHVPILILFFNANMLLFSCCLVQTMTLCLYLGVNLCHGARL